MANTEETRGYRIDRIDRIDRTGVGRLTVTLSTPRLVCPLDHRPCDHGCPSCRGDYAVPLRKKRTREERNAEGKGGR